MNKVELLAPAGDLERLKIDLLYGADAVYGGVSHFSLRNRSGKEFDFESFCEGVEYRHARGKKIYVTINGFPFNSQLKLLESHIQKMASLKPDGFIVATPGVVKLSHQIAPEIPIHLSTQANVLNVLDAEVFYELGVKRIIAARELSLKDAIGIKKALPDLELEIFVYPLYTRYKSLKAPGEALRKKLFSTGLITWSKLTPLKLKAELIQIIINKPNMTKSTPHTR